MSFSGGMARLGAAAVFTKTTAGSYDAATDTSTPPATVTVTGHAMEIDGDPDLYAALTLIESENPTLLFRPDIVGVVPGLGFAVVWGGELLTVKNIKRLAMAGMPSAARLIVGR